MSNENNLESRARFMSFAVLQALGRQIKPKAFPPMQARQEVEEYNAFGNLCSYRNLHSNYGLSGAVVFDNEYNQYDFSGEMDNPLVQGHEWLNKVSEIIAQHPSKTLFCFFDTVILMEKNPQKAKNLMGEFVNKIEALEQGGGNPIDWLCSAGGLKVNVASMITINGIESQVLVTHDAVSPYSRLESFNELIEIINRNSIKLIDNNMQWIGKLGRMERNENKFQRTIENHMRKGFVWVDQMHSEPLMEMFSYFGFGQKADIEGAIGKAIIDRLSGEQDN